LERVLVTGGAGFIGSHTVDALIGCNYDVSIVDNLYNGNRKNLNPKAAFFECDVTSLPALKKAFEKARPDFVLHFAAQINTRHSLNDPVFDATSNILGSINVLECCRLFGVKKAVLSSSCAVYGNPKHLPAGEDQAAELTSPYSVSKHVAEQYFSYYGRISGLDCVVLRYGNVFGPRQNPKGEAGIVSIFLEKMLQGKSPVINGDGRQTRDFVFVEDVASANLLALEKNPKSKAFNIGSGRPVSVNEVFFKLKSVTGLESEPTHGREIAGEVKHIYLDAGLAKKELNWTPVHSLESGLGKTVDWARQAMPFH